MVTASEFLQKIRIAGFDVDQTLLDEGLSVRKRWERVLAEYAHLSPRLQEVFFRIFDEKGYKYKTHLNEAFSELGISKTYLKPIITALRSSESEDERVYDGAREVIMYLKTHHIRVGVMTNGVEQYQARRLQRAAIYNLFDFYYFGDTYKKPDPAFFETVFHHEAIAPDELLLVGNDFLEDVNGALNVGAKPIWISEELREAPGALRFENMYTLLTWLKNKNQDSL